MIYESKWPSTYPAIDSMRFVDFDDSDSSSQFRSSAGLPRGDALAVNSPSLALARSAESVNRPFPWIELFLSTSMFLLKRIHLKRRRGSSDCCLAPPATAQG